MKLKLRTYHYAAAGLVLLIVLVLIWQITQKPTLPPPLPMRSTPVDAPVPQVASRPPDLVLDLFEPTPESLTEQQRISTLASQIEHGLTVTFLVRKCDLITEQEYADTYRALILYTLRSGISPDMASAAARVRTIADAASASYSLVYSHVPCDSPSLPPVVSQLTQWRASILAHGQR